MATGIPSRKARFSCCGTNRSFSPRRSPSIGERSRYMHINSAMTASANPVPSAAPATPSPAPGRVNPPT